MQYLNILNLKSQPSDWFDCSTGWAHIVNLAMAFSIVRTTSLAIAVFIIGILSCSDLAQAQTRYTASLSPPPYKPKDGDNSPPPPQSNAQGTAEFVLGGDQATYSLTLQNVPDFYQVMRISLLESSAH
jgi:hypothetical protein